MFLVWVSLTEHKWVTLGERRSLKPVTATTQPLQGALSGSISSAVSLSLFRRLRVWLTVRPNGADHQWREDLTVDGIGNPGLTISFDIYAGPLADLMNIANAVYLP